MRCPSWIPAGISTLSSRVSITRPAPSQPGHGCSTICPRPLQVGQAAARTNSPKMPRETWCSRPDPSQRSHLIGFVPGSTPSPPHVAHGTAASKGTPTVTPAAAVDQLDLHLGRDVGAALARAAAAHRRAEDVVAEERAEEVAEAADVDVRRREPTRPQAGVTVAVVERTRLGVGEHLVGLAHLAEADLGLGLARRRRDEAGARACETPS